jgi:hypothetical protein
MSATDARPVVTYYGADWATGDRVEFTVWSDGDLRIGRHDQADLVSIDGLHVQGLIAAATEANAVARGRSC